MNNIRRGKDSYHEYISVKKIEVKNKELKGGALARALEIIRVDKYYSKSKCKKY